MKLKQIAEASAPPGTIRHFQRTQEQYKVNDDGTIDIDQDFLVSSSLPLDFPKINRVFGDFTMKMGDQHVWNDVMPFYVDGKCKIYVGKGFSVKSSQLPRSTHGAGYIELDGEGTIEFDDDTITTYNGFRCSLQITGGLQFAPREWNITALSILDTIDGIPPVMENLQAMVLTMNDPTLLKGLHNRIKKVDVGILIVYCTEAAPLLGLLKFNVSERIYINYIGQKGTMPEPLNRIINQGRDGSMDIFEVQEALIDAGYNKHAKR